MTGSTAPQAAGAHCASSGSSTPASAATTAEAGAVERLDLTIAGMTCGHCVSAVREALGTLPGVEVHHVRIGQASLAVDPGTVSPAAVIEAIRDAGYQASFGPATGAGMIGTGTEPKAGLPQAPTGSSCCSTR